MKPDWDKLMSEFKGSEDRLIADVDCTAGGKELCNTIGVRGYPTIKYGDPNDLQDYKGGRSLAELKKFAESLGPQCGPANLDLCDAAKKKQIAEFQAMSASEREKSIAEKEEAMSKLESDFKTFTDGLQKSYTEANEKKDKDVEELKNSGLGILKAVHAHGKKAGKGEL